MAFTDKEIKRFLIIALIFSLIGLSFIVLKPIIISVISGLILAYIFNPIYKKFHKLFKEKNTAAFTVCALVVLVVFLPLWFLVPIVTQQTFDMFNQVQGIDIRGIVEQAFPTASDQFRKDISSATINFIGDITSSSLKKLTGLLLGLPNILLHGAVIVFVFFFSLRDGNLLREYISEISPIRRDKEKLLVKKFKEITSSILFGYLIIGIIQGIATGIGLLVFGVPRALFLTIIAIFASIFPIFGPWVIWVPTAIYLFTTGSIGAGIGFALYGALFVSSIDNFIRPYIVARKTGISSAIVLVGMIGGLFVFGILGLILGPLILSYSILFLTAYKEKSLAHMFASE